MLLSEIYEVMNLKRNLLFHGPTNQQLDVYIDGKAKWRHMGKIGKRLTPYIRLIAARMEGCSIGCTCILV